ncbi:MAG: helix-turn-helix domain-containing protein [Pseudomonadota bacterium]
MERTWVDMPKSLVSHREDTFRSRCSIARSLELVGDKWTLLIIRDLLWHGKHTFQDLQSSDEHIPSNILSQRLKKLVDWGLVQREAYQHRPVRHAYHLTKAGQALEPVLLQVMGWGHAYLDGGRYDPKSGKSLSAKRKSP